MSGEDPSQHFSSQSQRGRNLLSVAGSASVVRPVAGASQFRTASQAFGASRSSPNTTGRSRSRTPDDVTMRTEDITSIVEKAMGVLPQDSLRRVKKLATELLSDLTNLRKTTDRIKKHDNNNEVYGKNLLPNDVKRFRVGFECAELDLPWQTEAYSFRIDVPAGTSMRATKELLHRKHLEYQELVDTAVAKKRQETLQVKVRRQSFISQCTGIVTSHRDIRSELGLPLDEEDKGLWSHSDRNMEEKALQVWKSTVDRFVVATSKLKEAASTSLKNKQNLVDRLHDKTPATLFDDAVDARVEQKFKELKKKQGKGRSKGEEFSVDTSKLFLAKASNPNADPTDLITATKSQKNGSSPTGVGAQSNKGQKGEKNNQKGKGNGKQSKGKGKGGKKGSTDKNSGGKGKKDSNKQKGKGGK